MEDDVAASRKGAVDRSPRFPFISLPKALDRAAQLYEHEKRGAAPFAAIAQHWSYSPSSSGALQTLAALKSYGLLDGDRNSARLTELALRILLDKRPDSTERQALMRQAALTPGIASEVNAKWPDGLPSDATLNHFLVLDRGFNEATAMKSLDIIKQNHTLIGSMPVHGISDSFETNGESDMETMAQEKRTVANASGKESLLKNVMRPPTAHTEKILIEDYDLDVELLYSSKPTKEVFQYLSEYFQWKAGKAKKTGSANEP